MQVTRVKTRVVVGADGAPASKPSAAVPRSALSMYAEPPNEELTLEDFEVLAFERLKGACSPHRGRIICGATTFVGCLVRTARSSRTCRS